MTTNEVAQLLGTNERPTNNVSKHKGKFKYWRSYFYRHGTSPQTLVEHVKRNIPNAVIISSGDHWHDFVGSAKSGSAKDSYMFVTFTVETPEIIKDEDILGDDPHTFDLDGQ